ncbi:type II toxin-antitoxin system VapC family toxin [Kingella kingae]|uniref:type II toxin-antitoxin system VapC family toxin n=1 Tax=Kingella kingae TaxID=504 RepID=UPI00042605AA|nr:type II toxin-antitoxin system VapC family toxin [Kingella kingae]MDK4528983.1 type II toxin-antitoxin system VapC family toxin [Kingella kingae]MDK4543510.1 type II toxin-antitoxin system VapC family toxin [Kingella kingae]MDK4563075.1 type II toxin-antitoxin system VapC family toxin [Kingella kingae]MDK4574315.1 type II toxin-antitoxin system VapC family toxin [Kingella kingae]MDK4603152.1 type II toxin-antitoxin system VapC family toxin [Kingella kingae]
MMYLLDTNILIYIQKNNPPTVREKINNLPNSAQLVMSFVTYAELLKGTYGSQNPEKAQANLNALTRIISVLPFHEAMPEHYANWANQLKKQGKPIGNNDLWIAAHALAVGAVLVTHNTKEFSRINNLQLEDWAEE